MHRVHDEGAFGEVLGEQHLGPGTETRTDQIGDLGDHQGRNNERTGERSQQIQASLVKCIVAIRQGIQRAGVDDQTWHSSTSTRQVIAIVGVIGEAHFTQQLVKTGGNVRSTTRTGAGDTERAVGA